MTPEQSVSSVQDALPCLRSRSSHAFGLAPRGSIPMSEFTFELHRGQMIQAVSATGTDRAWDEASRVREADARVDRRPSRIGPAAAAGRLEGRPVQRLALAPERGALHRSGNP